MLGRNYFFAAFLAGAFFAAFFGAAFLAAAFLATLRPPQECQTGLCCFRHGNRADVNDYNADRFQSCRSTMTVRGKSLYFQLVFSCRTRQHCLRLLTVVDHTRTYTHWAVS